MYTEKEVLELMLQERNRAVDIALDFMKRNEEMSKDFDSYTNLNYAGISNECRLVATTISGLNGLSAAMGVTKKELIEKELEKWLTKKE